MLFVFSHNILSTLEQSSLGSRAGSTLQGLSESTVRTQLPLGFMFRMQAHE